MVSRQVGLLVVVFSLVLFMVGAGCVPSARVSAAPEVAFDATRAWADLEQQVAFGFRVPGTKAHLKTRKWLEAQLKPLAAEVTLQPFTHRLGGRDMQMWNIIARFTGAGAAPRETVLLCAHWDTRPTADYDHDPAKRGTPILGANDGASGVAVLLEIARQLKARPVDRDVLIVLFDGEDYGPKVDNMLLGSRYFAAHLPEHKPDWGILLDMIGDKDLSIYREPNSEKLAKDVNDRVFFAARSLGYLKAGDLPGFVDEPFTYPIIDDHMSLNDKGIPVADLIDFTYPPWHTTGDTADKCSADSLKVVGMTVLYAIQLD